VANINIRPWTVEFLVKLMKERGLPIEMVTGNDRFAFEKEKPASARRPYREDGARPPEPAAPAPSR
jgi:hypothetical protein